MNRSKDVESLLENQLSMQKIILDLFALFINANANTLSDTIRHALREIGEFVRADRTYIFTYDFDKQLTHNTFEWCAEGINAEIDNLQNIPITVISDWVVAHRKNQDVYVPNVSKMPQGNARDLLEPQGIKSLLTVPMMLKDTCRGFIGFDSVHNFVHYTDYERNLLRELANMIVIAQNKLDLEYQLADSRHMMHLVFNSIPIRVFWKDLNLRYLGCNQVFAEDAGFKDPSELIGKDDFDMGWAPEADLYRTDDLKVIESKEARYNFIEPQTTPSGDTIWLRTSKVPLFDAENKLIGVLGTYENITEFIATEERLSHIIEATEAGTWEWKIPSSELIVNERWATMLGYTLEELHPISFDTWKKLTHSDDRKKTIKLLRDLFTRKSERFHTEIRMKHKKGHWVWMFTSGNVITWNPKGEPLVAMGANIDVSDRKIMELSIKTSQEQTQKLLSQMPQGLSVHEIILDEEKKPIDYRFLSVNEGFEKITGLKAEELIGKTIKEVLPATEDYWIERFGKVALTQEPIQFEDYSKAFGKYFDVTSYSPAAGKFAVIFHDTTEQVKLNQSLFYEKQRLSRVVDSAADIIFEIDKDKRFMSVFGRGLSKINHKPEHFENKTVVEVFGNDGLDREKHYTLALEGITSSYEWDYKDSGHTYYFSSTISPIYDEDGKIAGAVGISRDITDMKLRQKEIEHMSFHDHLTELKNRRFFAESLAKHDLEKNYPLGIMIIDLNGLKIINDAYGHSSGDEALIKVAEVIGDACRKNDIAARIGGDEFAIILPSITLDEANTLKTRLLENVSAIKVEDVFLSLSIGFEIKTSPSMKISEVMKTAENYMYKHKLIVGKGARSSTIKAILKTLTDKYEEEKNHSERVSRISKLIAQGLGLNKDDQLEIEMAALFHDIGKISIPDAILKKPAPLTPREYEIIKTHTENGYQILRAADEYSGLAIDALYHHEHYDGTGYPEGLKGKEIPLFSRIISIADAYEAMTSDRPYRNAPGKDYAISELMKYAGTQFDPHIVKIFLTKVLKVKI